ncbi:hypothetical protein NQ318_003063, partial [Aromia moschata]
SANRLKTLLSFAVGGLLGDVFLHSLPEIWANDMAKNDLSLPTNISRMPVSPFPWFPANVCFISRHTKTQTFARVHLSRRPLSTADTALPDLHASLRSGISKLSHSLIFSPYKIPERTSG